MAQVSQLFQNLLADRNLAEIDVGVSKSFDRHVRQSFFSNEICGVPPSDSAKSSISSVAVVGKDRRWTSRRPKFPSA